MISKEAAKLGLQIIKKKAILRSNRLKKEAEVKKDAIFAVGLGICPYCTCKLTQTNFFQQLLLNQYGLRCYKCKKEYYYNPSENYGIIPEYYIKDLK